MKSIMREVILGIIFSLFILSHSLSFFQEKTKDNSEKIPNKKLNRVLPDKPSYGEPITFQYDPRSISKELPEELRLLIYKNLLNPPEIKNMEKKNGFWETTYTLTDTSIKMILYTYQAEDSTVIPSEILFDDKARNFWDILFHDTSGTPVRSAYQARALSYTGLGGTRTENLHLALKAIKKEISLYPENYAARSIYYTILLKTSQFSESTREKIEKEIDRFLKNHPESETIMNFAVSGYRMIGKMKKAQNIETKLIQQNPKSHQAAMKAFDEILKIEEPSVKAEQLEKFLVQFPETRLIEFALSTLATVAIELNDSTNMITVGDKLMKKSSTPAAASALAAIAGTLSEMKIEIDRAVAYSKRALTLTRSMDPSIRPPELSPIEWREHLRSTEAQYKDILGWAYYQKGDFNSALLELEQAAKVIFQSSLFYHLAVILDKTGDTEKALLNYARTVGFGGDLAEIAYKAFEDLWLKSQKNPDEIDLFLKEQTKWVDETHRNRLLSHRSIRPAPDFELEDLDGGWVRLSDQKGSVILLCFWASWSRSSQLLLEALQRLAENYGQNVLFLTVSTDVKQSELRDFIKKQRPIFPVLISNGTDQDYRLQGVPTLYIIDTQGNIHFEHKGYRPDIEEVLKIELEDLL